MVRKSNEKSKPEKKKLSMKTRLMIILVMFVLVNLIFYVIDSSDDSTEEWRIEQESEVTLEGSNEEQQYAKFNPPKP